MQENSIATRILGRTGLRLSELGFGAASLGNLYRPVGDSAVAQALTRATEIGIRYFDTAPFYGFGLSERRLGDYLRKQTDVIVSTKVGRMLRPERSLHGAASHGPFAEPLPFEAVYDYSRDGILRSHEDSLQRLGLANVDILFVHDIGPLTHGSKDAHHYEQLTKGGGLRALEELRDAGAVGAIGIGVNELEVCRRILKEGPLDVILLAGCYTLLEQAALDDLFPLCAERGTQLIIGGAFNSGILATGTRSQQTPYFNYAPAPPEILARVAGMEEVCDRHGVSLISAALQFPLAHPLVTSVIPGLASAEQVNSMLGAYQARIPRDFWYEMCHRGFISDKAPIPSLPG